MYYSVPHSTFVASSLGTHRHTCVHLACAMARALSNVHTLDNLNYIVRIFITILSYDTLSSRKILAFDLVN